MKINLKKVKSFGENNIINDINENKKFENALNIVFINLGSSKNKNSNIKDSKNNLIIL